MSDRLKNLNLNSKSASKILNEEIKQQYPNLNQIKEKKWRFFGWSLIHHPILLTKGIFLAIKGWIYILLFLITKGKIDTTEKLVKITNKVLDINEAIILSRYPSEEIKKELEEMRAYMTPEPEDIARAYRKQ